MNNSWRQILLSTTASTFEDLGYVLPDRELNEEQAAAGLDVVVRVPFAGAATGAMELAVCGGILAGIAANMLGRDEPPPPRVQIDAMGEIANVICGNVLPLVLGRDAEFRLQAPRPVPADEILDAVDAACAVGLGPGRAEVRLVVRSVAGEGTPGGGNGEDAGDPARGFRALKESIRVIVLPHAGTPLPMDEVRH